MELPDEVLAVGLTVGLYTRGAATPVRCARAQERQMVRAMPPHVRLRRTESTYLAEWIPRVPLRRQATESPARFNTRIGSLVQAATDELRACLARVTTGDGRWRVARSDGAGHAGVYVRGRRAGSGVFFLVEAAARPCRA